MTFHIMQLQLHLNQTAPLMFSIEQKEIRIAYNIFVISFWLPFFPFEQSKREK